MRILYVITGLGIGGAETQVLALADGFAEQGHEVRVAYLTGEARLVPSHPSVRLHGCEMHKTPLSVALACIRMLSLCKSFRPEVVHSHMFHANILARMLRILARFPRLISTAHSSNEGGRLRMMAYRLTNRLADVTTNVSREAVQSFVNKRAVKPGQMISVYNGIDTRKFHPDRAARLALRESMGCRHGQVVIAVGRLFEAKDYPNLLRAFAQVSKAHTDVVLWIVGDGPLKPQLIALAKYLGVSDRMKFLGHRKDIRQLLNAADVFVLSSAWEGLPLVVGEAMACACLVVATDCGGVAEFVGDTGVLVPPRDHISLANAIISSLDLPLGEREARGLAARRRIESQFSLTSVMQRWDVIYRASD